MAQDYAKKRQSASAKSSGRRSSNTRKPAREERSVLSWYGAGVVSGVFLCFLGYLGSLPSEQPEATTAAPTEVTPEAASPKPRFDFYTLLPEQTIDVDVEAEVEPAPVASNPTATKTKELYLLQAGSFRQKEDAERRRAELILLDLDPKVEEATSDNGRWFRVYVGPFASRSEVARARSMTAAQNIDTLLLQRGSP